MIDLDITEAEANPILAGFDGRYRCSFARYRGLG